MNKFITLYRVKLAKSCFKQLPLNFNFILELYHTSLGERFLFDVYGSIIFSIDIPLDYHSEIGSGSSENVEIVF